MIKWYVEYSIGDDSQVLGNLMASLPQTRINVPALQEIIKRIAAKENTPEVEVFIDNIAKISSN
jgi:hypothetical protein